VFLAEHFLKKATALPSGSAKLKQLSEASKKALFSYKWSGNVRELRQLMERVVLFSSGGMVVPEDLRLQTGKGATVSVTAETKVKVGFGPDGIDIEDVEKQLIIQALEATGGNVSEAARKLKLGREALRYRIQKFGLQQ
ncbi:MAG: helix-turn-helix domain-containing protein, partial [Limisphaerales bacterium]